MIQFIVLFIAVLDTLFDIKLFIDHNMGRPVKFYEFFISFILTALAWATFYILPPYENDEEIYYHYEMQEPPAVNVPYRNT